MNRRVVLNRSVAVVVLGFCLAFSSCKKDEKKIIGLWKYEKTELTEFSCSDPMMTIALKPDAQQYFGYNMVGEVEFTEDGKAIFLSIYGKVIADYKVNDSKLTIISPSRTEISDISFPDKKTVVLNRDADMLTLEELRIFLQIEQEVQITKCRIQTTLTKK